MKNYILIIYLLVISLPVKSQDIKINRSQFKITYNKPVKVQKLENGHYFIDFGSDYFGTVTLKAKHAQKDTLILRVGEKLAGPDKIDRNPGGTIRYQEIKIPSLEANVETTVKLPANKRNTNPPAIPLPDSFGVVMPFRYCELENLEIPISELTIRQKAYYYEFHDSASVFTSSDTVLDAIWKLCKHTIKATSFTGYYIDGDRERRPYEADACINQLSHYCADSVYSMARRTCEYLMKNPTWPTEWILQTVFLFYNDYLYTGNLNLITKYYDDLKVKSLTALAGKDGLISTKSPALNDSLMKKLGFKNPKMRIHDIVDWPQHERDGYEMKDVNTVVNSFYYENLHIMSILAGAIGNKRDSIFYQQKSIQVKKAINQKLFDHSRGIYVDGEGSKHASLHANMFPLAFNIVPKKYQTTVIHFIKSKGMACSVYGAQYLLEGLLEHGESTYAKQLITDTTTDRSWWNMIKSGSTMTMEAWDMKYKPNLDWNHAWGTAPLNIITRYLWGIKPMTPGFATAKIKPQLADLTYTEIKVSTIKGIIYASYRCINKHDKIFRIKLPQHMTAEFMLPETGKSIRLNNQEIKKNQKILKLGSGFSTIEIEN